MTNYENNESINKFKNYLLDERNYILDKVAVIIHNEVKSESMMNGESGIKLLKKTLRKMIDMTEEELQEKADRFTNSSKQLGDSLSKGIFDSNTLKCIRNISKNERANMDFLYTGNLINDFYEKRRDTYKESNDEECVLMRETDRFNNAINFVKSISDDVNSKVPIFELINHLENSYLKIGEKNDVIINLINSIISKKNIDNLEEDSLENYNEAINILRKYNITYSLDSLNSENCMGCIKELGASDELIKELDAYLNQEPKEEVIKEYNSNINSGIDNYEKKEEIRLSLREKLSEYFDLKDMHLKRFLNRKETNFVLGILN